MKNIQSRTDIINWLFRNRLGYKKSYLEIGLSNPEANYYLVESANKECVDPYENDTFLTNNLYKQYIISNVLTHRMTSDEFFAVNHKKYDLIFIDGLHHADQVRNDIVNSYNCLNPGGFIIIHDCLPYCEDSQNDELQVELREKGLGWNGSTWKAIPNLGRAGVDFSVVDIDYGCGIIRYDGEKNFDNYSVSNLTYNDVFLDNDIRNAVMHVITAEEFVNKL